MPMQLDSRYDSHFQHDARYLIAIRPAAAATFSALSRHRPEALARGWGKGEANRARPQLASGKDLYRLDDPQPP